jgi:hypothetical protein
MNRKEINPDHIRIRLPKPGVEARPKGTLQEVAKDKDIDRIKREKERDKQNAND